MTHPISSFSEDGLSQLTAEIARMGGLAESQVADAVRSVARRDIALAGAVIARDAKLDVMHMDIERRAIALIGAGGLSPHDLRGAVGAMKLALDLERTGDLAKSIARRGLSLAERDAVTSLTRSIERMGDLVSLRLRDVLDAYTGSEVERALSVWSSDDEVDEHYNALFRELLAHMMTEPEAVGAGAHLMFMAKNLERIGDHATNLAETIYYQITGDRLTGDRPRWTPRPDDSAPVGRMTGA